MLSLTTPQIQRKQSFLGFPRRRMSSVERQAGYGNAATGLKPVAASLQPASSFLTIFFHYWRWKKIDQKESQRKITMPFGRACLVLTSQREAEGDINWRQTCLPPSHHQTDHTPKSWRPERAKMSGLQKARACSPQGRRFFYFKLFDITFLK